MNKILLIEDNEQLQRYITEYLSAYGFVTYLLDDYDAVLKTVEEEAPKLILLDITLPKFDGFYYLKLIKKRFDIPVIIISARSEEAEQIRGIEGGADDYITKPFSIGVLIAKMNSIIKRSDSRNNDNMSIGNLKLSAGTMQISYNDFSTDLSKNEFKVLWLLMKNAGQIVTREQILEELWDDSSFIDDNTLTVNMTRVKKRLNEIGLGDTILTKRGIGYVFETTGS